jgi:hypothetical protein
MKLLVICSVFVIASILIVLGLSKKAKPTEAPVVKAEEAPVQEPEVAVEEVIELATPVEEVPALVEEVPALVEEATASVEEPVKAQPKKKPAVKKVVKNVK